MEHDDSSTKEYLNPALDAMNPSNRRGSMFLVELDQISSTDIEQAVLGTARSSTHGPLSVRLHLLVLLTFLRNQAADVQGSDQSSEKGGS